MRLTFADYYTKVHNAISGPGVPTGDDLTTAKNLVLRAYRKFLYPINYQTRTKRIHTWSWLIKPAELTMVSGTDTYDLPDDFDILHDPFTYDGVGAYGSITTTSRRLTTVEQSFDSASCQPLMCYITATANTVGTGQKKQVTFWPTPNSAYNVKYSYVCIPPTPTEDDEYLLGNAYLDEVILQLCLAVAEQDVDEKIGVQTQLATEMLQAAIAADSSNAPETVGRVRDMAVRPLLNLREWKLQNSTLNLEM